LFLIQIARALKVGRGIIGPQLLAVAVNAAVRRINVSPAVGHSGFRHRINVRLLFVRLRIEVPDLVIRDKRQSGPGEGERAEYSKKERCYPFHR
jgi:hypothetical protein